MSNLITNKYLAPSLQNPAIRGRGNASFVDNRTKTATPLPYIESITPGKNSLEGFIGNGTIPEPNAYIYIYINGFLINPAVILPDGTFSRDNKTAIVSDKTGSWKMSSLFFDALPAFQYGQTITFKAKAPLKQVSDRSVPYIIGGMPSPIELGTFGDGGLLRAPYEGESSIMGRIAYWMGHKDPYNGTPINTGSNHLYVYVDGMHVGTHGSTLGEVLPNEIRGTNAKFPIYENLTNYNLSFIVNNIQIDVPLSHIQPVDTAVLLGPQDGINGTFMFFAPDTNIVIKVYKNGLKLQEGFDYQYSIDVGTKIGQVNFNISSVVPVPGDRLLVLFQYTPGSFVNGEILLGITDGSNNIFNLAQQPQIETLEIYQNGVHLLLGPDFTISGVDVTITVIPEVGDLITADYQSANVAGKQLAYYEIPIPVPNGVFAEFLFATPDILGTPHIFKNGLLQQEGLFNDYTVKNSNIIKFNPWTIPEADDSLLVTFYATPVLLGQFIDYLNQTQQFKDNSLTASSLNLASIINYINIEGVKDSSNTYFILPLSASPVNFRLFKNGFRLKEITNNQGDYFLDYARGLIVLSVPPEPADSLVGLFNYITSEFVVGETPVGPIDGVNRNFTLSMTPKEGTVQVYYNGMRLTPFDLPDYVVTKNIISFITFVPSDNDIILVDYEVAFSSIAFTRTIVPMGQVTGSNPTFSFPTQSTGVAIHVFKNGMLQQPGIDYILNRASITFVEKEIPVYGDTLLIEFNDATLFTDNPNDQLRISSSNMLDIKRYSDQDFPFGYAGKILFGSVIDLYPGKDDDGTFRFWFNSQTGYWKYTWYDPLTGVTIPFTAGQRITARAKNDKPFIYTTAR